MYVLVRLIGVELFERHVGNAGPNYIDKTFKIHQSLTCTKLQKR